MKEGSDVVMEALLGSPGGEPCEALAALWTGLRIDTKHKNMFTEW